LALIFGMIKLSGYIYIYFCDSFRGVEFIIHTENMEEVGETRQWVTEGEKQKCRGTERNEERDSSQRKYDTPAAREL
jgi:hypothetical protein